MATYIPRQDEIGYRASDYNVFVLSMGYAEECRLSTLPLIYQGSITELRSSKKEAWNEAFSSLSAVILRLSGYEEPTKYRPCCLSMPKGSNFCSVCGLPIRDHDHEEEVYAKHDAVVQCLDHLWSSSYHSTPDELDMHEDWTVLSNEEPILRSFLHYKSEEFLAWFNDHRSLLDRWWDSSKGFWENVSVELVYAFEM